LTVQTVSTHFLSVPVGLSTTLFSLRQGLNPHKEGGFSSSIIFFHILTQKSLDFFVEIAIMFIIK
jgi:hypothetical protein